MSNKQKTLISIFLLSLLGGATSPVIKIGLIDIPPLSFAFLRFLVAGVCLLPFSKRNTLKFFFKLVPLSLLATANIAFFILGLKLTTANVSQLLYAGSPLLVALFLLLIFKQTLAKTKIVGIILGFLGISFIALLPIFEKDTPFSGNILGNLLISVGVICWSFYIIFSKKALKTFSPFVITFTFIWVTAIALFPFFIIESLSQIGWWQNVSLASILSLLYITTFSTVITYLLNQYAISHGGAVFASLQFYLVPIFVFMFSFLLIGEKLILGVVIGATFALLGVYITTKK